MWLGMTEAYSTIRVLGIVATVFSIYRGLTTTIPLDDIIAILAIALAMVWFGNDLEKRKARTKEQVPERGEALNIDLGKIIGLQT